MQTLKWRTLYFIRALLKLLISFPRLFLGFMLVLALMAGFYVARLSIDASSSTLLRQNDPDLKAFEALSKKYAQSDFLIVSFNPIKPLLTRQSLNLLDELAKSLAGLNGISSATSMLDIPLLFSVKGGVAGLAGGQSPSLRDKEIDLNAVQNELKSSPLFKDIFISSDLNSAAILLSLKPNLSQNKLHSLIGQIRQNLKLYESEAVLYLGGAAMIADDMIGFIKKDLLVYGVVIILLLGACLYLFFGTLRWVCLPLFICLASLLFSAGAFGAMGWAITAVSSNFIAINFIITISILIHLIVAYNEILNAHPALSQRQISYLALLKKLSASFWSVLTTAVGFMSLASSDIEPVKMLGIMMGLSVMISLVVVFALFASINAILPKPAKLRQKPSWLLRPFVLACASLALRKQKAIFALALFISALGLYGVFGLKVENSFIDYFDKDTEISKGMLNIDKKLGGTIPLDVLISLPLKKDEASDEFEDEFSGASLLLPTQLDIAKRVHSYLASSPFVGSALSIDTFVQSLKILEPKADELLVGLAMANLPASLKDMLIKPYLNENELRFSLRIKDSDENLHRNEFIKQLKRDLGALVAKQGASVEIVGAMVLYNNVLQSLASSQLKALGISIVVLFALFLLAFTNLRLALIAIVSNLVPLVAIFGAMGFFGLRLDVMSITIASIAFGIGVDNIIHYIKRYLGLRQALGVAGALKSTQASIGRAMGYTTIAIFTGFGVMASSEFVPTIYFGLLIDLVMAAMLTSALLLLPALISKFSR